MASIVPIIIRCIDYLAYGTIFTRAKKTPPKKVMFFAKNLVDDSPEVVVGRGEATLVFYEPQHSTQEYHLIREVGV
jgi:hypothetical protein